MRPERLSRLARAGVLVASAALVACARWEVAEEFTPDCAPPQPPMRFDARVTPPEPALRGHVVSFETGASVNDAVLWFRLVGSADSSWARARTDSAGRFEVRVESPGLWVLRTLRIGFWSRTDTLTIASNAAPYVILPLARPLCDPDFGIAVVQRKPWWKFW